MTLTEPSDYDYAVVERLMMNLVPVGPLTRDEQEGLDAYEAHCAALMCECGVHISTGGFDPYGTSCDLDAGHDGPHEGPDFFGNGRLRWTGGGSCAGDALAYHVIDHDYEVTS